jgi:hypothetical protein
VKTIRANDITGFEFVFEVHLQYLNNNGWINNPSTIPKLLNATPTINIELTIDKIIAIAKNISELLNKSL